MLQINVVPDKSAVVVVHPTPGVGDATTIADALRMIPNGGDVHVRDGTYAISAGLTVPLNTKIVGAGRNKTIFNMTGAFTLFTTTGGYFCLSEVTVQGDNTSAQIVLNTNHDVDIACSDFNQIKGVVTAVSSAAEVSMTDCYILLSALAGTGIYLWKGATDGVLRWDYVHMTVPITSATLVEGPTVGSAGCRWKVVQSYTGGPPPPVANFYYLQSVDWVNFKIDFAKVSILSDTNKIVGCDFQSCWIRLSPPFASKTLISGCNFELGGDDVGLWVAQLIIGSATSEVVVSGCQFRGNGVSFTGVYVYNSSDIAIDGCTFIAHTTAGVYLEASVPASSAVVTGCRFSEPTPVFENGPDCVGIYASNDGFSGSVLVGLRSTVDAENYRNVRTWGAVGNGTTDDTINIQAALTSFGAIGGTLFFPPGTYKITSTLTFPNSPVTVRGSGDSSILDISSGSFAAFTVPTGLTVVREYLISDLKILGGGGGTSAPVGGALSIVGSFTDAFASAGVLSGGNGAVGGQSNVGFTLEGGEPAGIGSPTKTAWATWTAPASGTCTIDTLGTGPFIGGGNGDTVLGVYTGAIVSALTLVVENDDGAGFTFPNNFLSKVVFSAIMGTTYRIRVGGFGANSGTFNINMTLIAGAGATTNNVVSIGDANSRGVAHLERVNADEVKYPIKVTDGSSGTPVLITVTDCFFQQLADNSSILIVNSPSYKATNLFMDKVRFYRTYEDAVVGAIAEGGFYSSFTNVNIIAKDSYFAHGSADCTIGALNLQNCFVANYGVGANKRICVADDNFSAIRSAVVGCNLSFVDFDLAGNGTYFSACYVDACGFRDTAISFFDSCYFTDGGVNPTDTVVEGTGDTIIKGCYFNANLRSYSIKRPAVVDGCKFYGNSAVTTAYIFLSASDKTTISNCNFKPLQGGGTVGPAVAGIHLSGATECIVSNNRFDGSPVWTVPPILEAGVANLNVYSGNKGYGGGTSGTPSTFIGAKSVVEGENVQTVAVTTTLDETYRTVRVDASGASRTINLPTAASYRYKKYTVIKIDSTANAVVVDPSGAETINGVTTYNLTVQYQSITFVSNGTSWDIV